MLEEVALCPSALFFSLLTCSMETLPKISSSAMWHSFPGKKKDEKVSCIPCLGHVHILHQEELHVTLLVLCLNCHLRPLQ